MNDLLTQYLEKFQCWKEEKSEGGGEKEEGG